MLSSVVVVALAVWVGVCEGYSTGAPPTACDHMTPKHRGIPVQTTPHRYVVRTHKTDGGRVRVSITSEVGEELQGFALQARSASDLSRSVPGRFSERDGVHSVTDCPRGPMLTHVSPADKREVLTEWTPDEGGEDQDVVFRATVLKDFSLFWTEVDSKPVRLGAGSSGGSGSGLSNRARTQPKKEDQSASGSSSSRMGRCSVSRGCLGLPAGCVRQGNCQALLSYGADPRGGVAFELSGPLSPRSYMAVGFSLDAKMGDDFVTDCIRMDGSNVLVRESWNSGQRNNPLNIQDLNRRKYSTQFVDGVSTCSWTSDISFDFNGVHFDLENSTYLLLAEGQMDSEVKQYHRSRVSTPSVVNFTAFKVLGAAGVATAIKVHGALMVTAWIGFVSLGVLVARYYKEAWKDSTVCGVKVWFALHRSFMIIALTCVAIAVIIIFVHYEGWNSNNIHAIFGIITIVLGFLQPIMAAFRPSPDSAKRPLFNWLHFSVGTLAHLLSLVSLFLATKMAAAGLDRSFYWALAVFVVVYLFFHVLLQLHLWKTNVKKNNEINMLNMSGGGRNAEANVSPKSEDKAAQQNVFRVVLLCIYTVIMLAILITLYVLIGNA